MRASSCPFVPPNLAFQGFLGNTDDGGPKLLRLPFNREDDDSEHGSTAVDDGHSTASEEETDARQKSAPIANLPKEAWSIYSKAPTPGGTAIRALLDDILPQYDGIREGVNTKSVLSIEDDSQSASDGSGDSEAERQRKLKVRYVEDDVVS